MTDWINIGKTAVFRDKSKGGLLTQFLKEYKQEFGGTIHPSCMMCLNGYWNNYINSFKMSVENNCDYELHKKYNGIQTKFGGAPIRNSTLTNEIALDLLKNHPRGEKLFIKLPKIEDIEVLEPVEIKESEEEVVVKEPVKKKRASKKAK